MSVVRVGQNAPDFDMPVARPAAWDEALGGRVSLADYRGRWLVLFFYPLDFSNVCPTEIIALSDRYEEFEELGAQVLGVSVDSVYAHRQWMHTPRANGGVGMLNYPLASDVNREASRAYGVLAEEEGIALRGLFIIDPEAVLQYMCINSMAVGRSSDETLRVLLALQTGGYCPADWRPGKSMLDVYPNAQR